MSVLKLKNDGVSPVVGMRSAVAMIGLVVILPAFACAQAPAVTAFVNVSVVPMDRERVLPKQTVVVRGDRIVALGPAGRVRVPAEATRIDGRGRYLIPGLADMHAHVPGLRRAIQGLSEHGRAAGPFAEGGLAEARRMLFLWLANGVTTIRVMYGYGSPETLHLREAAATGALLSPRLYVAAGPLDLYNDGRPPSADSAVRFVINAKAAGYDLVKLHGVGGVAFDSVVAVARRVGIPVAGHVPDDSGGLTRAIQAGYASIEHLTGLDGIKDEVQLRALAAAMQQAGIWNCPTLINNTHYAATPMEDSMELRVYSERTRKSRVATSYQSGELESGYIAAHNRIIQALHTAGAGLLLGTDAPTSTPGFSVHRELEAFVRAGLTPYEALLTGTRNVAAYFGTLDSTGTVAVGKRADLVLLEGNPLTDIRHTAHPAGVMVGGRWLSRTTLNHILTLLEGLFDG